MQEVWVKGSKTKTQGEEVMKPIESLLDLVLQTLDSLGFQTFVQLGRRSPFDVLAKKGKSLILIKILTNIDGIKESQAMTLKTLAGRLGASALIVGERTKAGKMLDGVAYERYGIYAVTPKTLREALLGKMPKIKYWKGKLVSKIPKRDMERIIESSGIEEIAKILGVSKEAVYQYKSGKMGMDENKARKLADRFSVELDSFNILSPPSPAALETPSYSYLKDLEKLGFEVVPVFKKFDAIAKEKESLILAKKEHPVKENIEFLKTAGKFLDSHPAIVSSLEKESVGGVPVIRENEIKSAKKAKDVIKLVKEREEKE